MYYGYFIFWFCFYPGHFCMQLKIILVFIIKIDTSNNYNIYPNVGKVNYYYYLILIIYYFLSIDIVIQATPNTSRAVALRFRIAHGRRLDPRKFLQNTTYILSMSRSRSRSRISKFFKGRGLGIMFIAIHTIYMSVSVLFLVF